MSNDLMEQPEPPGPPVQTEPPQGSDLASPAVGSPDPGNAFDADLVPAEAPTETAQADLTPSSEGTTEAEQPDLVPIQPPADDPPQAEADPTTSADGIIASDQRAPDTSAGQQPTPVDSDAAAPESTDAPPDSPAATAQQPDDLSRSEQQDSTVSANAPGHDEPAAPSPPAPGSVQENLPGYDGDSPNQAPTSEPANGAGLERPAEVATARDAAGGEGAIAELPGDASEGLDQGPDAIAVAADPIPDPTAPLAEAPVDIAMNGSEPEAPTATEPAQAPTTVTTESPHSTNSGLDGDSPDQRTDHADLAPQAASADSAAPSLEDPTPAESQAVGTAPSLDTPQAPEEPELPTQEAISADGAATDRAASDISDLVSEALGFLADQFSDRQAAETSGGVDPGDTRVPEGAADRPEAAPERPEAATGAGDPTSIDQVDLVNAALDSVQAADSARASAPVPDALTQPSVAGPPESAMGVDVVPSQVTDSPSPDADSPDRLGDAPASESAPAVDRDMARELEQRLAAAHALRTARRTMRTTTRAGGDEHAAELSRSDVGQHLPEADLAEKFGITQSNLNWLALAALRHQVVIELRPSNRAALGVDGTPKPEAIKGKTLSGLDRLLGGPNLPGAAAHFQPRLPANYAELHNSLPLTAAALKARFDQRLQEWNDPEVTEQLNRLAGLVELRNGVYWDLRKDRPFIADNDLFDIRNADGSKVDDDRYQAIITELRFWGVGVEHGVHVRMPQDVTAAGHEMTATKTAVYEGILKAHDPANPEATPVLRISPQGPVAAWPSIFTNAHSAAHGR